MQYSRNPTPPTRLILHSRLASRAILQDPLKSHVYQVCMVMFLCALVEAREHVCAHTWAHACKYSPAQFHCFNYKHR